MDHKTQQHTHGGKRPGAGRKPLRDGRKSRCIRIRLTEAELKELLENTDPDTRRDLLLDRYSLPD